ncbi:hypothetical protein V6N13_111618 [Hibiscus sabdariffa]|uniref:Uncharacterized protein n=1 Tax=Hibiscus sabdariffa TaxID=183260 RepID=A0ABR2TL03_9ROSI
MTSTIPESKVNMHAYFFLFLFWHGLFHLSSMFISLCNFFFLQEEGWVVCRAFKKRTSTTGQNKTIEQWDSSYFYDEASGIGSGSTIVDPIDYIPRQQPQNFLPPNMLCKQEIEADNLNFVHCDQFVQLPQLESPSLPFLKRPNSIPLISENSKNYHDKEEEYQQQQQKKNKLSCDNSKKVTDWRALDKFVASQLSQEIRYGGDEGVSSFEANNDSNSDMALLLLQSSSNVGEEGNYTLNEFSNPSPDCDIGICVFDK